MINDVYFDDDDDVHNDEIDDVVPSLKPKPHRLLKTHGIISMTLQIMMR